VGDAASQNSSKRYNAMTTARLTLFSAHANRIFFFMPQFIKSRELLQHRAVVAGVITSNMAKPKCDVKVIQYLE
jgi:hypothetical protein